MEYGLSKEARTQLVKDHKERDKRKQVRDAAEDLLACALEANQIDAIDNPALYEAWKTNLLTMLKKAIAKATK